MSKSDLLFRPITVNRTEIANRFVCAAARDHLDGDVARRRERYAAIAAGGTGLIISGGTNFADRDGWRTVIAAVHERGGQIMPQLVPDPTPGALVSELPPDSVFFDKLQPYHPHRRYDDADIAAIFAQYADRAAAAHELGADGVEIHAAHNSRCAQFLSPLTNKRTDKWGGSLENRLRFHKGIYTAVRNKVGDHFPVIIKLGIEDAKPGGLTAAEGVQAAAVLAAHGYDAVEVSLGLQDYENLPAFMGTPMRSLVKKPDGEAYFRAWSREIKALVAKPVILTGGIFSPGVAAEIVAAGCADMVGMCRALIRQPALVRHWRSGDLAPASCIACNKCTTELYARGLPLECFLDRQARP